MENFTACRLTVAPFVAVNVSGCVDEYVWCDISGEAPLKGHYKLHGQSKETTNLVL